MRDYSVAIAYGALVAPEALFGRVLEKRSVAQEALGVRLSGGMADFVRVCRAGGVGGACHGLGWQKGRRALYYKTHN